MKYTVILVTAIVTCLFFASVQASATPPLSLPTWHCTSMDTENCSDIDTLSNEIVLGDITTNIPSLAVANPMRFSGVFTNTTFGISGLLVIDITFNPDDTITGYINFSQFEGDDPVCGAGDFEGTVSGEKLEMDFTSNDLDPGCGFDHGSTFAIEASLSHNKRMISGSYSSGGDQQGTLQVTLVPSSSEVYMPMIRH
jgi:hypothetical protein